MTELHTLASGSSGNALLLSCDGTHLLIDAGISCRRITKGLEALGLTPEDLTAICITHIHGDHICGLQVLLKRCCAPIYASAATCRGLAFRLAGADELLRPLPLCTAVELPGCTLTAFPTAHDAKGAAGYRIDSGDGSVGILTDTGYITEEATAVLLGVDTLVLEANHDVETLRSGPYPYYLKKRILGGEGHLCNEDAGRFAAEMAKSGTGEIILAHLSKENNTPAMAHNAVALCLSAAGLSPRLSVAPRDETGPCHRIERRVVCSM